MTYPARVRITEVGPRDGLQNEPQIVSVDARLGFIERLVAAGLSDIEIGAFVHPKWVPQMAATDEVLRRLPRLDSVRFWALVPNRRGLARAVAAGARHVAFVLSASETHSRRNLNKSRDRGLAEVEALAAEAARRGLPWRGYISVAFGCPYEGAVDFRGVMEIVARLLDAGAHEVSLGDTTGMGGPGEVRDDARRVLDRFGAERIAFHFHDTQGMGVVNAATVLAEGAVSLDSSTGGIGGCPYAPGAAGNLATEELVRLLDSLGIPSGVAVDRIVAAARWLSNKTGIQPPSRYYRYAMGKGT